MALVQLSSNIDDIKGSIGRITYAKGRSGIIEKHKSHPGSVNPFTPSPAQLTLRDSIRTLSPMWKALTDQQRSDWNALALTIKKSNAFGQPYLSSGFNLYIQFNHNLYLCGCGYIDDAPTRPTFTQLNSITLNLPHGLPYQTILALPNHTANNVIHLIYATPCLSPGIYYIRNQYRLIGQIHNSYMWPTIDISAWYDAHFPSRTAGMKIFIKLRPIEFFTGWYGTDIFTHSIQQ